MHSHGYTLMHAIIHYSTIQIIHYSTIQYTLHYSMFFQASPQSNHDQNCILPYYMLYIFVFLVSISIFNTELCKVRSP